MGKIVAKNSARDFLKFTFTQHQEFKSSTHDDPSAQTIRPRYPVQDLSAWRLSEGQASV